MVEDGDAAVPLQPVLAHDEVVDLAGDLLPAVQVPAAWQPQPAGAGGDELHRLAPELGPHLQFPAVLEAALRPLRPPAGDGRVMALLHRATFQALSMMLDS